MTISLLFILYNNTMAGSYKNFHQAVKESKIIHMPKSNIATFGNTVYNYYFISEVGNRMTRIREGNLNVNRPLLITSFFDENNMRGFPEQVQSLAKNLFDNLGIKDYFLEYRFENILKHDWKEKVPMAKLSSFIIEQCQNKPMSTILSGSDEFWTASLVKLCIKTMQKSFPINMQEIEERGFLDKDGIPPQVYKEIERLFKVAEKNPKNLKELGQFLLEHQLFERYEDKFFSLMSKSKPKK